MHLLRRNVGVNVLLFDNRIYGLTKGQYSPTSEAGKKTKSTPLGSVDDPVNPLLVALGAGATFVANGVDVYAKELQETLSAAAAHEGGSFVRIFQNCNIFNDGAFKPFTDRGTRAAHNLYLRAGEPLEFGEKEARRGFRWSGHRLESVLVESETDRASLAIFDPHDEVLAAQLARFEFPHQPVPIGTIYQTTRPTFEERTHEQIRNASTRDPGPDLQALVAGTDSWTHQ